MTQTINSKIKYKLYGINKEGSDALNAAEYYPIPATPEFDSYSEAKTFYVDTVTLNENFYRIGTEGYFKTIVIAKTLLLLPHKTTDGPSYSEEDPSYSEEDYFYDSLDTSKGLVKL